MSASSPSSAAGTREPPSVFSSDEGKIRWTGEGGRRPAEDDEEDDEGVNGQLSSAVVEVLLPEEVLPEEVLVERTSEAEMI